MTMTYKRWWGGSGISWTICKFAPCCGQMTMPARHHSFFSGRTLFKTLKQYQRTSVESAASVPSQSVGASGRDESRWFSLLAISAPSYLQCSDTLFADKKSVLDVKIIRSIYHHRFSFRDLDQLLVTLTNTAILTAATVSSTVVTRQPLTSLNQKCNVLSWDRQCEQTLLITL